MAILRPYIQLLPYPINYANEDFDSNPESCNLYHVLVSQGKIKLLFLVVLQDYIKESSTRRFETIRCESLSLHGIDERDKYLGIVSDISLSADSTIVQDIFKSSLEPFGITLKEVTFHDFDFFQSEIEDKGFTFSDTKKYEILKNLINKKCILMMNNPNVIQR